MSGTKSASWPQWLASVESDLFTSDPVQRSKEWQGWTNLHALPVFCRGWRVDLAKARMSANKNEPALILEVAAEWPALKMQRLFSTVFFFWSQGWVVRERLDIIFMCSQRGPDWQAAWEKCHQNALHTRRRQTARRMMEKMCLNPLNGVTRLLKAPSHVVSFDCFLVLEWNVFRSFSRLLILFISLGKMRKAVFLKSHSLLGSGYGPQIICQLNTE